MFAVDQKGNTTAGNVTLVIQYGPTGSGVWNDASIASGLTVANGLAPTSGGGSFTVRSAARKTLRCGARWKVAAGQYDVRVTRVSSIFTNSAGTNAQSGDMQWTVLRSISPQDPSTTGTTKLAIRIQASDQLNGTLPQVSVLAA